MMSRSRAQIELCRAEHIVFEAYSSLGGDSPDNNRLLLAHPAVRRIASCHTHGETGAFSSLSSSSACTTVSRSEAESSDADFECSSAATGSMGTGAAVTPAQVLLRFAVQDDIVVIPKVYTSASSMILSILYYCILILVNVQYVRIRIRSNSLCRFDNLE